MMNLYEKIITIYPSLTDEDFFPHRGTILLQNDGQGDYIASWTNELPQPTQEQLDAIN
jgi:hypothetical protein